LRDPFARFRVTAAMVQAYRWCDTERDVLAKERVIAEAQRATQVV